MKYEFKQAAEIDGKEYSVGEHEVADAHADHHFFKKLVEAKLVHPAKEMASSAKPFVQHMKDVFDKVVHAAAHPVDTVHDAVKSDDKPAEVEAAPVVEAPAVEDDAKDAASDKKKRK